MQHRLTIYILGDYKPGAANGLAEFSYQNVQLLKNEFSFHFVEFDDQQLKEYYFSEERDEVIIHRFGSKGLPSFKLSATFKTWLKTLDKKDILFHLNHIYNINNYLVARYLKKNRVPYLITPHDSYVYCPSYLANRVFWKKWYRKLLVRFADKFVLDNAALIQGLTVKCPPCLRLVTDGPIKIVGNQVADTHDTLTITEIKPQVCYIGRFDIFQKGIDRIIKAYSLFKSAYTGGEDIHFVLVGPANSEESGQAVIIAEELGLKVGQDVIFTGKISAEERNHNLRVSKVYLQMSRYEGFGLSIIEALSHYKPVVVSKEIPIYDKIVEYGAGFMATNEQEAADALARIFALPEQEYIQMSLNARKCYEEQFHPDIIKPQLISLYNEAFANARKTD